MKLFLKQVYDYYLAKIIQFLDRITPNPHFSEGFSKGYWTKDDKWVNFIRHLNARHSFAHCNSFKEYRRMFDKNSWQVVGTIQNP